MMKGKQTTSKERKSYGCLHAHVPHEVILQILENLPVKTLMRFTCVSKLWFKSIRNDKRLQEAHFLKSQKNTILMFKLLSYSNDHLFYFYLPKDGFGISKRKKVFPQPHQVAVLGKLIGTCNGLVCYQVGDPSTIVDGDWSYFIIDIFNFSKHQKIRNVSRIHNPKKLWVRDFLFGYDCLSNKYKLMCILSPLYGDKAKLNYKYLILELGSHTQLWREIKNPATLELGYSTRSSHYINGDLYWWMYDRNGHVLLSFDLHEEKFQVIELPKSFSSYSVDHYHQLEYRRCFCFTLIKKYDDTYSGAVEFYILKDRIKQVWIEESIIFDLPVTIGIFPPTGIKIQIIGLAGRIFLYWRKLLVHEGITSSITEFYDLESKEVIDVRLGSKFNAVDHYSNHVESLICLRTWGTKKGHGGEKLGRIHGTTGTLRTIQDMIKQMPKTLSVAVSFYSSSRGITMS